MSVLQPVSDAARTIESLWWLLFAISLVVFAVVTLLVLLVVLRGRANRPPGTPDPHPSEDRNGVRLIVIGGLAVPVVVLTVLAVVTVLALPSTSAPSTPALSEGLSLGPSPLVVRVVGKRFFWEVDYPGAGVTTANELHIPAGVDVVLEVTSADVIHSFWAPRLNRKIDLIPGHENRITLRADMPGVYRGQCAEFCGLQHALMAFEVVAQPRAEFDRWLEEQARPAAPPTGAEATRGQQVFDQAGCSGCHRIAGTPWSSDFGPDLTHLASRRLLAAGTIPNDPSSLARWIRETQKVKPGNRMPEITLSDRDLDALVAYLDGLR